MKKVLLGTSALVGVGLLAMPAMAQASRVKLSVGGYMEQYVGYADGRDVANVYDFAKVDLQSDSEIYFTGSTKLDNGITFSVVVELEADESSGGTIDESYMRIVSPTLGELRVGGDDAVDAIMVVQANRGISGDYDNWIVETNMSKNDNLYDNPASDTNKVSYFTPKIAGFQVGATYAPRGSTSRVVDPNNYATESGPVYAAAATYETKLADVGIKLGTSWSKLSHGAKGTLAPGRTNYTGGAQLSYMGFALSGGYARTLQNNSRTTGTEAQQRDLNGHRYQLGLQYATGPYTVGVWHMKDENEGTRAVRGRDKTKVTSAYGNYVLSDGVRLEGMVFHVDYDNEEGAGTGATANQDGGWGVVAGFRLDF